MNTTEQIKEARLMVSEGHLDTAVVTLLEIVERQQIAIGTLASWSHRELGGHGVRLLLDMLEPEREQK